MTIMDPSLVASDRLRTACPRQLRVIVMIVAVLTLSYLKIGGNLQYYQGSITDAQMDRPAAVTLSVAAKNTSTDYTGSISPVQRLSSSAATTIERNVTAATKIETIKFFIIAIPETTTDLVKDSLKASSYYHEALNEESAEIWLHRSFERLPQRTLDPHEADVFVVAGYLHLYLGLHGSSKKKRKTHAIAQEWQQVVPLYAAQIIDPSKPHLLLVPTWNPSVSRSIGVHGMVQLLQQQQQKQVPPKLWSVGFERNPKWQHLPPNRIVPIPYVVSMDQAATEASLGTNAKTTTTTTTTTIDITQSLQQQRIDDSIFYVGDSRKNAEVWAGCYREKLVYSIHHQKRPLHKEVTNSSSDLWTVQLLGKRDRMEQSLYNTLMTTNDWCLILCGDTPTSRTLTSSMISGCIPLRVGSRLRGLCEAPCHKGFGWTVTGAQYPHLPFAERIDWMQFPEINEAQLMNASLSSSSSQDLLLMQLLQEYDSERKNHLRNVMQQVRPGWIYGWGDPVTSIQFGEAANYIWESWVAALQKSA